jgi:hypothetical protein
MRINFRLPAEETVGTHTSVREDYVKLKPEEIW